MKNVLRSLTVFALCFFAGRESKGEVLEFSGPGCAPCMQYAPTIDKLVAEGLPIRKIDVAADPATKEQWHVDRWPTTIVVKGGREVERVLGPQSEAKVRQMCAQAGDAPHTTQQVMRPTNGQGATKTEGGPWNIRWNDPTIVLVTYGETQGEVGAGAIVNLSDGVCIVTCAHKDGKSSIEVGEQLEVQSRSGQQGSATTVYVDAQHDLAILKCHFTLKNPQFRQVASKPAVQGDQVTVLGFPLMRKFNQRQASVLGYSGDTLYLAGGGSLGESGGPVVNSLGEIVGELFGDEGNGMGNPQGRSLCCGLYAIQTACHYVAGKMEPGCGTPSTLVPPPTQPPTAQNPPTCICPDYTEKFSAIERRLKELENAPAPTCKLPTIDYSQFVLDYKQIAANVDASKVTVNLAAQKPTSADFDGWALEMSGRLQPFFIRTNATQPYQQVTVGAKKQYIDLDLAPAAIGAKQ